MRVAMNRVDIASRIERTNLKPDDTEEAVVKLCEEARENGFYTVCVNPCWVRMATSALRGTKVQVCSVAGFPLGAHTSKLKAAEAAGATVEDVELLKSVIGNDPKIKAAGGIRDARTVLQMIEAGVDRIGTSLSVAIMSEFPNDRPVAG